MQGDHKEQNGYHSLNRWKERLALQHRHAEMSTGSKPCILRGILSKGPQALMTRLGPSPERGPGTQPTNSKWSFHFVYATSYIIMCSIERRTNLWSRQCIQPSFQFVYITSNVFYREEDRSMVRAVAQYYIHQQRVFYQSVQYLCI